MAELLTLEDLDKRLGIASGSNLGSLSDLDARLNAKAVSGDTPENPINEQHPEFGTTHRLLMNVLSAGDEASAASWLQNMGFQAKKTGPGFFNLSIRKPADNGAESKWYRIEPRGFGVGGAGEMVKDVGDLTGEALEQLRSASGFTSGFAAGSKIPGPAPVKVIGGLVGGVAGATGANALIAGGLNAAGRLIYGPSATPIEEVALAGGIRGGAGEVLGRGVGKVLKGAGRVVAGRLARGGAEEAAEAAATQAGKKILGTIPKEATAEASEAITKKLGMRMWGDDVVGREGLEATISAIAARSGANRLVTKAGEEIVEATPEVFWEIMKKAPRSPQATKETDIVDAVIDFMSESKAPEGHNLVGRIAGLVHGTPSPTGPMAGLPRKAEYASYAEALRHVKGMPADQWSRLQGVIKREAKQLNEPIPKVTYKPGASPGAVQKAQQAAAKWLRTHPQPKIAGTGAPSPLEYGAVRAYNPTGAASQISQRTGPRFQTAPIRNILRMEVGGKTYRFVNPGEFRAIEDALARAGGKGGDPRLAVEALKALRQHSRAPRLAPPYRTPPPPIQVPAPGQGLRPSGGGLQPGGMTEHAYMLLTRRIVGKALRGLGAGAAASYAGGQVAGVPGMVGGAIAGTLVWAGSKKLRQILAPLAAGALGAGSAPLRAAAAHVLKQASETGVRASFYALKSKHGKELEDLLQRLANEGEDAQSQPEAPR